MTTNKTANAEANIATLQRAFTRAGVMVDGRPINLRSGHGTMATNPRGGVIWEFHGPAKFKWRGRADNVLDARVKGWEAWLQQKRPTEFDKIGAMINGHPFWLALLDRCAMIGRAELRDRVRGIIDAAAKHAYDNAVYTEDRDEGDPEDDGGWLFDFRGSLAYESGQAPPTVRRWFKRHCSLAIVSPIYLHLIAQREQISDIQLRKQIIAVMDVAVENADEYEDPHGWDDAFLGTIENRCEDDVPESVSQWFQRHSTGAEIDTGALTETMRTMMVKRRKAADVLYLNNKTIADYDRKQDAIEAMDVELARMFRDADMTEAEAWRQFELERATKT